ncbi:hypothetical protein MYAM1_002242 [Malassezia yamatoensis]|uniref:Uncharacterized protein n=1 Tax=Malassezia yamatoensis TaxID=253288 RepID=A0AAJ5YTI3_9BASI|nr:hypothetical protein MYAM1_002242 [Malassezia yamatoensis]
MAGVGGHLPKRSYEDGLGDRITREEANQPQSALGRDQQGKSPVNSGQDAKLPGAYTSPEMPPNQSEAGNPSAQPNRIESWNAMTQFSGEKEPLDSMSPISSLVGSPNVQTLQALFSPASSHNTMHTASDVYSERSSEGYNTPQTVQSAVWRFVQSAYSIPEEPMRDTSSGRETHTVVHHDGYVLPPMKLNDFTRQLERSASQRSSSSSDSRSASSWLARRRERDQGRMPRSESDPNLDTRKRDKGTTFASAVRSPLSQTQSIDQESADKTLTDTRQHNAAGDMNTFSSTSPIAQSSTKPYPAALAALGAPISKDSARQVNETSSVTHNKDLNSDLSSYAATQKVRRENSVGGSGSRRRTSERKRDARLAPALKEAWMATPLGSESQKTTSPSNPATNPAWNVSVPVSGQGKSPSLEERMGYLHSLGFQVDKKPSSAQLSESASSVPAELLDVRALHIQKPQAAEIGSSWSEAAATPAMTVSPAMQDVTGVSFVGGSSNGTEDAGQIPPPPLLHPSEGIYLGVSSQASTPVLSQSGAPSWAPTSRSAPSRRKASEMLDDLLRQTEEDHQRAVSRLDHADALPSRKSHVNDAEEEGSTAATPRVDRTVAAPALPIQLDQTQDGDSSQLSMLGNVVQTQTPFHMQSYFDVSLQRVQTEVDNDNWSLFMAPGAAGTSSAPVTESQKEAVYGRQRRSPHLAIASMSPMDNLDEFTYILHDGASQHPSLRSRPINQDKAQSVPMLPPLDTFLPEEREIIGAPLPAPPTPPLSMYPEQVQGLFGDWDLGDAHTTTALPLKFVTRPNSVLSRGRPVKKFEGGGSIFYASLPDTRRKTFFAQPPPLPQSQPFKTWNFEDEDEEWDYPQHTDANQQGASSVPSELPFRNAEGPQPSALDASEPAAARQAYEGDAHAGIADTSTTYPGANKKRKAKKQVHTKYMANEGTPQKHGPWWRRKGASPTKPTKTTSDPNHAANPTQTASAPTNLDHVPRNSTSTSATTKHARRTGPPGFEPSQPGKYYLAGTVSLPTLNIARTPEQRARNETGLSETEPALIQALLAAPSSSTVRARAGIIKTLPFTEEVVPPFGQVLVAEERKILVRPVM